MTTAPSTATPSPLEASLAAWVSRLVQIPSVNPIQRGPSCGVPGELALATFLAARFEELGATEIVLDEVLPDRPNVYGWFPGRTDRLVVLDVHTDTVTVENMTDPPFDGRIEGGAVWGRGALDTKASMGTICALLEAWNAAGLRPEPTLLVVGSISEEAGGLLGAGRFREWAEDRGLDIDQMIISEPTMLQPIHGHKGVTAVRIEVHGESAHSSMPERGRNAIFAAARVVTALELYHEELVRGDSSTTMGTGTLNVSLIQGGIGGNVIPDSCTIGVGRRLVPGEDVQVAFDRIVDVATKASPLPITATPVVVAANGEPGAPAFFQTPHSALISTLSTAVGAEPATAPFGTNATRYFDFAREKVVFGPGNIEDAHRPTEHVLISDLVRTAHAFTQWLDPA